MTPPVNDLEAIAVPPSMPIATEPARSSAPLPARLAAERSYRYEVPLAVLVSGVLALALAGYPGVDAAAHRYLADQFAVQPWRFWDNYWYAGRYELINYSLLYYPLATLVGEIVVVAVSVAAGAGLFSSLVMRQWGAPARWSSRLFAISLPALMLSGQYPFALGAALGLAALVALQRGWLWMVVLASLASLLASPLAFLLLIVVLAGLAFSHREPRALGTARVAGPLAGLAAVSAAGMLVFRAFPAGGSFPYPILDVVGVTLFSVAGYAFARGSERTRVLCGVFLAYLALGWAAKVSPNALGGNASRLLDYMSAPLLLLVIALRGFRPRFAAVVALGVALVWQAAPLARNAIGISLEQAQAASFWRPAQRFFDPATHLDHRDPDYRVEVVATWGHWESYYLAGKAGIPIARGWHRQDDFPQNRVFYQPGGLTADTYRAWLSDMAVRYVLLPHDELDSSALAEARLLLSGQSGLRQVAEDSRWTIYEVPDPTPILTPPAGADPVRSAATRVYRMTGDTIVVNAPVRGPYVLRMRYSPYWRTDDPTAACIGKGQDGMSILRVDQPGPVRISFDVSLARAAATASGNTGSCSAPPVALAR